jgi:hypothetical protein
LAIFALWATLASHFVVNFGGGVVGVDELAAVDANYLNFIA